LQGAGEATVDQLERGDLDSDALQPGERDLLQLVEQVTRNAHRTTAADIDRVRSAGWNDEQIAEAIYVTAVFAMFNRVADAFGLDDPGYRELAAEGRAPKPAERARSADSNEASDSALGD
jgi:hypothetical protein